MQKSKEGGWLCKICGQHFRIRSDLYVHIKEMNHRVVIKHKKDLYTCPFCNKSWFTCKSGFTSHKIYCKSNPNRVNLSGHPHTEEMKKYLSEKRKAYLANNPDQHVWKRNSKFSSTPCNDLKEFLIGHGYTFVEESSIIPDRNFAVDICFPDKKIVVEVNGNQHYDLSTMELKPYYKERHALIESYGWFVIEVPYNKFNVLS